MQRRQRLLTAAALSLLWTYAGLQSGVAQNLITDGGFESGVTGWNIFVPDESQGKNCRFDVVSTAPHSGVNCVRLQSDDYARYSIGPATGIPVKAGEHYRVTAWIRADPAALVRAKTPGLPPAAGFVIRLNLRQGTTDAAGGHMFIGQGNVVTRDTPAELTAPLPTVWTKVEAVVEIPADTDTVFPALFCWWVNGTVFVDDFAIEKVADATGSTAAPSTAAPPAAAATPPPALPAAPTP
jgi:hypothetical protein